MFLVRHFSGTPKCWWVIVLGLVNVFLFCPIASVSLILPLVSAFRCSMTLKFQGVVVLDPQVSVSWGTHVSGCHCSRPLSVSVSLFWVPKYKCQCSMTLKVQVVIVLWHSDFRVIVLDRQVSVCYCSGLPSVSVWLFRDPHVSMHLCSGSQSVSVPLF